MYTLSTTYSQYLLLPYHETLPSLNISLGSYYGLTICMYLHISPLQLRIPAFAPTSADANTATPVDHSMRSTLHLSPMTLTALPLQLYMFATLYPLCVVHHASLTSQI